MPVVGLHHVQIAAPLGSEAEVRTFYGGRLGMAEIPKPPHLAVHGGVWFRLGMQELHVGVEAGFVPARKAHPAFLVDGLGAYRASLEQNGVRTRDELPLPGFQRFYADDPFGNRLEFAEPDRSE